MHVISVPPRLRLVSLSLLLSIPLIAFEVIVISRVPWWNIPYSSVWYWSVAVGLVSIPLSSWILNAHKWASTLLKGLAFLWVGLSAWLAIRLQYPPLGFFTVFMILYFVLQIKWVDHELTRSYIDPHIHWYELLPKAIPHLSCQLSFKDSLSCRMDFKRLIIHHQNKQLHYRSEFSPGQEGKSEKTRKEGERDFRNLESHSPTQKSTFSKKHRNTRNPSSTQPNLEQEHNLVRNTSVSLPHDSSTEHTSELSHSSSISHPASVRGMTGPVPEVFENQIRFDRNQLSGLSLSELDFSSSAPSSPASSPSLFSSSSFSSSTLENSQPTHLSLLDQDDDGIEPKDFSTLELRVSHMDSEGAFIFMMPPASPSSSFQRRDLTPSLEELRSLQGRESGEELRLQDLNLNDSARAGKNEALKENQWIRQEIQSVGRKFFLELLKSKQLELNFQYKNHLISCHAIPTLLVAEGLGAGIRFSNLNADTKKEISDFIEILRGEGYV